MAGNQPQGRRGGPEISSLPSEAEAPFHEQLYTLTDRRRCWAMRLIIKLHFVKRAFVDQSLKDK